MAHRRWILAACLLAACTSTTPVPAPTLQIDGTCSKEGARGLVSDFFASWNARDVNRVVGLFSPGLSFHDNVGGKLSQFSGDDNLRRYLAERFVLDDRFSNLVIEIPENPAPLRANPTVSFVRTASGTTYRGNAKLVCSNNLLIDLVMSAE